MILRRWEITSTAPPKTVLAITVHSFSSETLHYLHCMIAPFNYFLFIVLPQRSIAWLLLYRFYKGGALTWARALIGFLASLWIQFWTDSSEIGLIRRALMKGIFRYQHISTEVYTGRENRRLLPFSSEAVRQSKNHVIDASATDYAISCNNKYTTEGHVILTWQ